MWYRSSTRKNWNNIVELSSEEKMIHALADKHVRRDLYLKNIYFPKRSEIDIFINDIMNELYQEGGNLNIVRSKKDVLSLEPIIKQLAKKYIDSHIPEKTYIQKEPIQKDNPEIGDSTTLSF